jgi:hypothetical protein
MGKPRHPTRTADPVLVETDHGHMHAHLARIGAAATAPLRPVPKLPETIGPAFASAGPPQGIDAAAMDASGQ